MALYNSYYPPTDTNTFLRCIQSLETPKASFRLLSDQHIFSSDAPAENWFLADRTLTYAIWDPLFTLDAAQEDIPLRRLPKEEFLFYSAAFYHPSAETERMYAYLAKEVVYSDPQALLEETALQAIEDSNADTCLQELQRMGAAFGDLPQRREFIRLYRGIYDTVRKPSLRGHTEQELAQLSLPQHIKQRHFFAWFCSPTEKYRPISDAILLQNTNFSGSSLRRQARENAMRSPNLPPRLYEPCPCGSGLYYEHCCGKR